MIQTTKYETKQELNKHKKEIQNIQLKDKQEESLGVKKNNINDAIIPNDYTLIIIPDFSTHNGTIEQNGDITFKTDVSKLNALLQSGEYYNLSETY